MLQARYYRLKAKMLKGTPLPECEKKCVSKEKYLKLLARYKRLLADRKFKRLYGFA
jgi:hypothetical protein